MPLRSTLTACPVLESRKANPTDKKDILNMMLTGVDKETGQKLSEQSIKNNVGRIRPHDNLSDRHHIVVDVPHCW